MATLVSLSIMRGLHLTYVKFVLMQKEQVLETVLKTLVFGLMWSQHLLLLHGSTSIKELFQVPVQVGGYPLVKRRSVGMYTLIAQDDLNTLGYSTGGLDRNIWCKY